MADPTTAELIPFPGCESSAGHLTRTTKPRRPRRRADPVFAAIDAHRRAQAALDIKRAHRDRLDKLADDLVGPMAIQVPSLVQPGQTVMVSHFLDLRKVIPPERDPKRYDRYLALIEHRREARRAIKDGTDEDEYGEAEGAALWDAQLALEAAAPVTLDGLMAKLIYLGDIAADDTDAFDTPGDLIEQLGAAARALWEPAGA